MRNVVIAATAAIFVVISGCSGQEPERRTSEDLRTYDASENAASPGVDVTAAPGVAFNYRYAFRLPGNRIASVQEAHAQACERLGIAKCRITGMRYRLVNQKDIQAMLALRLDPALARGFGKEATETVRKADGMLVDQEIAGEDVGSRIVTTNRDEAQLREELARIEAELARPVPMLRGNVAPQAAVDRQSLLSRAEELRRQIASLQQGRGEDEERLAGTPMVFNYGSGSVVPGFDVRSPVREALQQAADNFVGGFAAILVIVVTLIPWLLVAGLVYLAYRRFGRRWRWTGSGYREAPPEPPAAPRSPNASSAPRPPRRKTAGS